MTLYRIKDWSVHFENNRTRELKAMAWVPVPNKQDGDGYTTLVSRENGAAILGAWLVILQIASKCDPRGTLLRDGKKPHDPHSLARISRLPAGIIQEALEICVKEVQWIEIVEDITIPQDGATIPQGGAPRVCARNEGKGMELKEQKEGANVPAENSDPPLVRLMTALNTAYQRSPKQAWNYADEQAAVDTIKRDGWEPELQLILTHRRKLSPDDRRFYAPSVFSCLSKFDEWLDKARVQKAAPIKSTPPPAIAGKPQDAATLQKMADQIAAHRKEL